MSPNDLERYKEEAASLGRTLAAAGADEDKIWSVYASTERLIAILKFRFDYETPGVYTSLPEPASQAETLERASELLSASAVLMEASELARSVEALRGARNILRVYLIGKKKKRESGVGRRKKA